MEAKFDHDESTEIKEDLMPKEEQPKKPEQMSTTELEALCYQQIKLIRQAQYNIDFIEAELAKRSKPQ
jgi:hypothetical protein